MLASQGTDVVCPTISLFHEVQLWNRQNIPGYREIYLRVPMEELRRRDAKGIYAAAARGDLRDVVGLDVPAELPEAPESDAGQLRSLDSSSRGGSHLERMRAAKPTQPRAAPGGRCRFRHQGGDA